MTSETETLWRTWFSPTHFPELTGDLATLTIFAAGTRRRVGTITLTAAQSSAVYIGWYGESSHHGRGLMTDAVRQILPQLFGRYHRVVAMIDHANIRSKNLAQRAGFRYEGTAVKARHYAGVWHDIEVWAMLEEDLA